MTQNLDLPPDDSHLPPDDEARLGAGLRAALHRQDCPDTMALGEYQLGLLAEAENARVAAHLQRCPYCRAEFDRLAEFLAEERPVITSSVADKGPAWNQGPGFEWQYLQEAGRLIIRVVREILGPSASSRPALSPASRGWAFGGVRSEKSGPSSSQLTLAIAEVEDLEVTITAEPQKDDPDYYMVTVKANIPSRGGVPNLAGTHVTLKEAEQVKTDITDTFGLAIFEKIAADSLVHLTFEIEPGEPEP